MSNHVALTQEERNEVAEFWGEFFRNGGVGRQPTPFQLDAVNDQFVRDALLFWQIDGDPMQYNDAFPVESVAMMQAFGPAPQGPKAIEALTKYVKTKNEEGVEIDDLDTGTVFVLMHVMWELLAGNFSLALNEAEVLSQAVVINQFTFPENHYPHSSPLGGLGMAAYLLLHNDREKALALSAEMFGLPEDHPNVSFARSAYIADRLVEKEVKNDNAA